MLELFTFALILMIAGVTLVLIGLITQYQIKKTVGECTEVTEGVYLEQVEVARGIVNDRGGTASAYAPLVEYEADGTTWQSPAKYSEGIGMMAERGLPVIVHYNPVYPALCWAKTPDARMRQAGAMPWLIRGGIAALVVGAIIVVVTLLVGR